MQRTPMLAAAVSALMCVAHARQDDAKVSMDDVTAAFARAKEAVETALATKFDASLTLHEVTPEQLGARVADENFPVFVAQGLDEERARAQADVAGRSYAQFAYAKFAWSTGEFLFVPRTLEMNAKLRSDASLLVSPFLDAVMVHELVHAADHRRFDFDKSFRRTKDQEGISALNAVVEGHAQLVARRVCAKSGWSDGFERMTKAIGALPKSADKLDAATRMMLEVQSTTLATSYLQGETFLLELEKRGGAEALERAFTNPPSEMEIVYHPEWFLHPETRPERAFDFDAALDVVVARYPSEDWSSRRTALTPDQFRAAMSMLDLETVEQLLRAMKAARLIVLQPVDEPDSKLVVFGLYDFGSYADALLYVAAAERINKLKDEALKKGTTRITEANYTPFSDEHWKGMLAHKTFVVGLQKMRVSTAVAGQGRVVVETIFSGEEIEDEAHLALARSVLEAAIKTTKPAEKR